MLDFPLVLIACLTSSNLEDDEIKITCRDSATGSDSQKILIVVVGI